MKKMSLIIHSEINGSIEKISLILEGELDSVTAPELDQLITNLDESIEHLVFDLQKLDYTLLLLIFLNDHQLNLFSHY